MDCYLDGELSGCEMLALRNHVANCPDCAQELQAIRILKTELAALNLNRPNPGAEFEDRLVEWLNFQAEQRPIARRRRLQAAFVTTLVIAVVAMLGVRSSVAQRQFAEQMSMNEFELAKDQAYVSGEDPLSGSPFLMPASFNK
jgi:anti-sigma factor RsiW